MPRRRNLIKLGLVGLAVLAVAGFAAAQALSGADRILLLQAKRFEGTYKVPNGESSIKVDDKTAEWTISSGTNKLNVALAPKEGKPDRATMELDGKKVEGKAEIEGKTLTMEFTVDKTKYVFKLSLQNRTDGEISVKKGDATLVSGAVKRS
ncbi:hypothetical protein EON82_19850 [bacterium]|nr:MAG: hypothetical protein EON82_19850 [bacterium]